MWAGSRFFQVPSVELVLIMIMFMASFTQACLGGGSARTETYQYSCPDAKAIIYSGVEKAIADDPRMAASLLRLHFHDCFVNGCDASILLDDTATFVGEKTAQPNLNSVRGFEVIDGIKSELENTCPGTVSCADILAIAARDSVVLSGGPTWQVAMGRKDSLTANKDAANANIPNPNSNMATLINKFLSVGLTAKDLVTLSGAHTIGKARCISFNSRLQTGSARLDIEINFLASLQESCSEDNSTLMDLDLDSPMTFDNQYYVNLIYRKGLLKSDQDLFTEGVLPLEMVDSYAKDQESFFNDFKESMVKMSSLVPLPGTAGEVRRDCRTAN